MCDVQSLLSDLKSCSLKRDLHWGRRIHAAAVESGGASSLYVATALIKMYAKCGSMVDARQVFDSVRRPNVVAWTVLLLGHAENGEGDVSLELFSKMKASGCSPDSVTYVAVLKACTSLAEDDDHHTRVRGLRIGRNVHSEIDVHMNSYVKNTLIDMYAKHGSMVDARQVFDSIQTPDLVSWNVLLLGYAEQGEGEVSLELFVKMKADGFSPDSLSYVAVLKACASLATQGNGSLALKIGREIHLQIGDQLVLQVQNSLINMYAKCGSMVDARRVFDSMQKPNVVSWSAVILGYAENGEARVSLELFSKMKADTCAPNSVTYIAVLKACTSLAMNGDENEKKRSLEMGCRIHWQIGDLLDLCVQNTLIDLYAKCGSMVDAHQAFDSIQRPDVASWTAVVLGYAENGNGYASLELFSKMKAEGCVPDSVTYIAALKACSSLVAGNAKAEVLKAGRKIHLEIGHHLTPYVRNTLIDMYAKCGSMAEARKVFDGIERPEVMSWNALLLGYADNAEGHVSVELFFKMKADGYLPNSLTYVAALKACSSIGAFDLGREIHSDLREFTVQIVTGLVDLYAKCGRMVEACAVFDMHPEARDLTTWTALLAGYSSFGDTATVFKVFQAMQDAGFTPDGVTFACILLCCSHAGLVKKAKQYLEAMPVQYGIIPSVLHYSCVVDGLGRANKLVEACSVLREMPCNPGAVAWSALLSASRKWRNVEIGRMAFESLVEMNEIDASAFVLMSHIYGSRGMWEDQARVLENRKLCAFRQVSTN